MIERTYLVSACLLGLSTRFDGRHNYNAAVVEFCRRNRVIPVCPEQLGGLPTPRPAAEICRGDGVAVLGGRARVLTRDAVDCTAQFMRGAALVLQLAELVFVDGAILKERSPSCGLTAIYDGTFSGVQIAGLGVTAALLRRNGIPVFCENNLPPSS